MNDKTNSTDETNLTPKAKKVLKIMFFTLFLDLIGFSIIFPLFPALAKHYMLVDQENFFLKALFGFVGSLAGTTDMTSFRSLVLFGGLLGALYSLLQFLTAPFWGSLSDRIGRKPVLTVSFIGLSISYLLWIFAGSFTLLILARLVGGIFAGNISTASAVVADITTEKTRSKGMAFIGIAFAIGFVFGPAMGGILSLVDLTKMYPEWASFGINPFSVPAILSFILAVLNLYLIIFKFEETLKVEKLSEDKTRMVRTSNPLKLFSPLPFAGTNQTNFAHFIFLTAFSGMEFTITFLAVERLAFTSLDNGVMFIFIGFVIAMVQGGFVRRRANKIGEQRVVLMGLVSVIPGLLLISQTKGTGLLYLGLFFLAMGSAMIIPCITSLMSLYTPKEHQGRSLGVFRSMGALARVIGPMIASLIYFQYGSASPYYVGTALLVIPLVMVAMLPKLNLNEA
jgi:MFS family permease